MLKLDCYPEKPKNLVYFSVTTYMKGNGDINLRTLILIQQNSTTARNGLTGKISPNNTPTKNGSPIQGPRNCVIYQNSSRDKFLKSWKLFRICSTAVRSIFGVYHLDAWKCGGYFDIFGWIAAVEIECEKVYGKVKTAFP